MIRIAIFARSLFLGLVLLALLAVPQDSAFAGKEVEYAWCQTLADGSGHCEGNFLGFRNQPNSTDYISFARQPNGSRTMSAVYEKEPYGCTATDELKMDFDLLMLHRDAFYVGWDKTGHCNLIALFHGSQYSNY